MSRSQEQLLPILIIIFVLWMAMSGIVRWVLSKSRKNIPQGDSVPRPSGGWILGMLECYFYFAVLSVDGAGFLAGAWLAFKLATRWQSARWSKPTELETRVGYRAFQVGTIGNLLVGVIGAAILRA